MNFFEKLVNAKSVSCNMTSNNVVIDGVNHVLYNAVLHSNWHDFNPTGVIEHRVYDSLLHDQKFQDKPNKVVTDVDQRFNIKFMDGDAIKSITIEYNKELFKIL